MPRHIRAKRVVRRRVHKKATKSGHVTKKWVKSFMNRKLETKEYITQNVNSSVYVQNNTLPTQTQGLLDLIPGVPLGNNSSSRIANKISVVSSKISGTLSLKPYDAVTNPYAPTIWVKMFLVSLKNSNTATPALTDFVNFFKVNGSSTGFYGNSLDLSAPVDTDYWTVHRQKIIRLGSTGNSSVIPQATSYYFDNSKSTQYFSFNTTRFLKNLTYNDTTTNSALNKNLWLVIQPVYMNATASSGNVLLPIICSTTTLTKYKDA